MSGGMFDRGFERYAEHVFENPEPMIMPKLVYPEREYQDMQDKSIERMLNRAC